MKRKTKQRPMIFSRVEQADLNRFQKLADRLYDGNLSLLVRIAMKRFADEHEPQEEEEAA